MKDYDLLSVCMCKPAPDRGTSITRLSGVEGDYFSSALPPPQISVVSGPIFKRCLIDMKNLSMENQYRYLSVTDDVTGQVIAKMFDDLAYLILSRYNRIKWK